MRCSTIISENGFDYIETNPGAEVVVLLHGLFGELSNFKGVLDKFGQRYNVIVPVLPIFTLDRDNTGLEGLNRSLQEFVKYKGLTAFHLVGNSLGGHLAQLFSLDCPEKVKTLTLTGSSGLFEKGMGTSYPQRGNYEYMKAKAEETFYDPKIATKELVDIIFETVSDREKTIKIILTAKSAIRQNLEDRIVKLMMPTLLIWGRNDTITPDFVGKKFNELIPNSSLVFIDKCGHAPMMEHPDIFNEHLGKFISQYPIPVQAV